MSCIDLETERRKLKTFFLPLAWVALSQKFEANRLIELLDQPYRVGQIFYTIGKMFRCLFLDRRRIQRYGDVSILDITTYTLILGYWDCI